VKKLQRNRLELGVLPPDPFAFGGLGIRPKTSNAPLRIPGYATAPHRSFNAEYQAGKLSIQLFKSFGPNRQEKLSGCAR